MNVNDLKELTGQQYDQCQRRAADRIQQRVGDRPARKHYERDYARLWDIRDALAGVIFLAALAVSSLHILAYSGHEATTASQTTLHITGLSVDPHLYGVIHQIGFILLAEAAMLLFFVLYRTRTGMERWSSLVLAFLAMTFVIVANLSSGLNPFLSILAPAFTVGIGFRLEALIAEALRRRDEIDQRYLSAMAVWESAQNDLTTHPDYRQTLYTEIWDKLVSLKANAAFADAPRPFKLAAVQRELQRANWAADVGENSALHTLSIPTPAASNGHRDVIPGTGEVTPDTPFVTMNGNGHHS